MTSKDFLPVLSIGLALAATGPPASAVEAQKMVVVDARNSDLERGTVIGPGESIRLETDAKVVLMTGSGETVVVRGPHDGPVQAAGGGASETGVLEAVLELVRLEEAAEVPGSVRGGPDRTPDDVWAIDPGAKSPLCPLERSHCLPEGAPATLWRAEAGADAALEIWGDAADAVAWWEPGETVAAWPGDLPLDDGARYELSWEDSVDSVKISIRRLPAGLPEGAGLLGPLIEEDCPCQASVLLARLAATAVSGPSTTEPDRR